MVWGGCKCVQAVHVHFMQELTGAQFSKEFDATKPVPFRTRIERASIGSAPADDGKELLKSADPGTERVKVLWHIDVP